MSRPESSVNISVLKSQCLKLQIKHKIEQNCKTKSTFSFLMVICVVHGLKWKTWQTATSRQQLPEKEADVFQPAADMGYSYMSGRICGWSGCNHIQSWPWSSGIHWHHIHSIHQRTHRQYNPFGYLIQGVVSTASTPSVSFPCLPSIPGFHQATSGKHCVCRKVLQVIHVC